MNKQVNTENVRKWIDALRSGKYKQGKQRLRAGDNYCCLGVACEVAIENGVKDLRRAAKIWAQFDEYGDDIASSPIEQPGYVPVYSYGDAKYLTDAYLPWQVATWLGLDSTDVNFPDDGGPRAASRANDEHDWTFEQIADKLEEVLLAKELVPA